METSRICACEQRDFEKLVGSNPDIAVKVIQTLGAKLSQASEQLADAAVRDVRERVVISLVRLAKEYGQETRQGLRIGFRLTHEDLGSLVGASRVMVTNVLHDLRKAGEIVTDDDRRFIVSRRLLSATKPGVRKNVFASALSSASVSLPGRTAMQSRHPPRAAMVAPNCSAIPAISG